MTPAVTPRQERGHYGDDVLVSYGDDYSRWETASDLKVTELEAQRDG